MNFTDHDTLTAEPVDSLVHARNMYAATEGEWRDAVCALYGGFSFVAHRRPGM